MNFGFFLVDDAKKIIYLDLYMYYVIYRSGKYAKEKDDNSLFNDYNKLDQKLNEELNSYTFVIDMRMDIVVNKLITNQDPNFFTENSILRGLKTSLMERMATSSLERFYILGERKGKDSTFGEGNEKSNVDSQYEKAESGFKWRELDKNETNRIYELLGINEFEDVANIVKNKLNLWLQEKTVVRKPRNEWIYLESANVYANEYIFIKRLYLFPIKKAFYIYRLFCEIIDRILKEKGRKEWTLVSASSTGALLATELCVYMNNILEMRDIKVKCQHVLHLGPKANFERHGFNFDKLTGNYIYIFDFMCEGSEYNALNNLLAIKDVELLGAFGIARYDYPRKENGVYRNEGIVSLIDVHTWDDENKNYKIKYE